jgi:acyl carrier protein
MNDRINAMTIPTTRSQIVETIGSVLREVDPQAAEVSEATCLMGKGAVVDSVGLVNLLIGVEQAFHGRLDISSLFLEHSDADGSRNPFCTIGALADLICRSRRV